MKAMNIKKKLYVVPTLFFCVALQGAQDTESEVQAEVQAEVQVEEQTEVQVSYDYDNEVNQHAVNEAFNLALTRKQSHHLAKPNNTAWQNNAAWQNMNSWQNNTESQNNMGWQGGAGWQNMPASKNMAGFPDADFGPNGQGSITHSMGSKCIAHSVATQPHDNKIVVAGAQDNQAVMTRYNDDGSKDMSFGAGNYSSGNYSYRKATGNGIVTQNMGASSSSFHAVAVQKNDQKIVAGGQSNRRIALARHYENGAPDTLFGDNGVVKTNMNGAINAVAIQKDQKIVAAGYVNRKASYTNQANQTANYAMNTGYDANQNTDYNYTNQANQNTHYSANQNNSYDYANRKASYADQNAHYSANQNNSYDYANQNASYADQNAHYSANQNNSYNYPSQNASYTNQHANYSANQNADYNNYAHQNNGDYADQTSDSQLMLMRCNKDGSPDHTFGKSGVVFTCIGQMSRAHGIAIQEDNKIVVVGTVKSGNQHNVVIARYNEDGTLDTRFGTNHSGIVSLKIGKNHSAAYDVMVNKNNRIIVVGCCNSLNDKSMFTVICLKGNGSLDTSFGQKGVVTISPRGNAHDNAYARSVALDANGKIIAMGQTTTNTHNYASLVRLHQNGALDKTFGYQGAQISPLTSNNSSNNYNALNSNNTLNQNMPSVVGTMQYNGKKVVLAGSSSSSNQTAPNQFTVSRYLN